MKIVVLKYGRIKLMAGFLAIVLSLPVIFCSVKIIGKPSSVKTDRAVMFIIDPGHGGVDGGSSTADGVPEKLINLEIAIRLRDMLETAGLKTVMTRETDISIHDIGADTIRKKKVSDLKNRLKLTEKYPEAIYVSIHQNEYSEQYVHGAQVFYSPNAPESKTLAALIQRHFNDTLQPDNNKVMKKCSDDVFVIHNAKSTAVLIESGFLSNREEAAKLLSDSYQKQVAFTIFSALSEYIRL